MVTRYKMRRFCLLLSYCGKNYSGMQRNPGAQTIEECLLKALRDSQEIEENCFLRPQLMYFQRAARTDKGVSAIRQIVSIKLRESISDNIDKVNKFLPPDIRLMSAKRVTGAFDAKNLCSNRTYAYLMPSFALCPPGEVTQESYRLTKKVLDSFNVTLEGYVGTHVFHNFTSGKAFTEDSSTRVIRYMNCSEPFFPCNQKDLEFVLIRVKGQSFMMHQIRKMIGLAIAIAKGYATEDHLRRSMEKEFMDIPKVPGLGLMLEHVHFDSYNKRFGGDGKHERLEWDDFNDAIDKFKEEFIYPTIVETEIKEKSLMTWLKTLALHSYGSQECRIPRHINNETLLASHTRQVGENIEDLDELGRREPKTKRQKTNDITEDKNIEKSDLATG